MNIKSNFPLLYEKLQLLKMDLNHYKVVLVAKKNKALIPFKDKHKGKRCFIVATGPSLTAEDLNLIKDEICFGVNSCVKAFDRTVWRPKYLCIMDGRMWPAIKDVVEAKSQEIDTLFLGKDLNADCENVVKIERDQRPSTFLETQYFKRHTKILERCKFYIPLVQQMERYLCDGPTVVHSTIELAIYMGFREIYLLGTDCNYKGDIKHSSVADYKMTTSIPDNVELKLFSCYRLIKKEIHNQSLDVNIYNSTRGGMLEVFERRNLEDVVSNKYV